MQPLAVALFACGLPLTASAQEEGGLRVGLTYSERLLRDEDDTSLRSDLGLELSAQTRRQKLAFALSGRLDKPFDDGLKGRWEDPRLSLSYGLESRQSALDFDVRYNRSDINSLVDIGTLTNPTLVLDEGMRETLSTRLGLEFGREAPFGGRLSLGYAETNYLDTISPTLLDSVTRDGALTLRFEIDPRIIARTTFSISDQDRDGGVDVRTEKISAGAALLITQSLSADVEIGWTRVTRSGGVPRSTSDGLTYGLALQQEVPNGDYRLGLSSDINENGRRTTLRVDRSMELRDGALSFGVGLSRNNTGSTSPLYALSYSKDLPRGSLTADLQQSYNTSSTGAETRNTRAELKLQQDLTLRDQLNTTLALRETETEGTSGSTRRLDLGFDYTRALTGDWSLIGGWTHSRRTAASGRVDIDDTLFIGLKTALEWRP